MGPAVTDMHPFCPRALINDLVPVVVVPRFIVLVSVVFIFAVLSVFDIVTRAVVGAGLLFRILWWLLGGAGC